ncbi:craniofacial development protein 2-like [Montipora capricornis]|uniref:craniofacial development protein 2-like n=1 Tax=Montipora capricornis TaxID=246305 RepID=UPI0035F1D010
MWITETLNTPRQPSLGANAVPCLGRQRMTPLSQSREDAQELNKPLVTPRTQIRIGNWNMRTMYTVGKSAQVARVMNQMKIQIMGINECRWIGAGRMELGSSETVLYSGPGDDQHMQGVAIMMNQEATKALIHWSPIKERIIKILL